MILILIGTHLTTATLILSPFLGSSACFAASVYWQHYALTAIVLAGLQHGMQGWPICAVRGWRGAGTPVRASVSPLGLLGVPKLHNEKRLFVLGQLQAGKTASGLMLNITIELSFRPAATTPMFCAP